MWYKTWARYAWKADRNRVEEIKYWNSQIDNYYGVNEADARRIQRAYDESGEIAPKLLRRFGITEGNRQTLLLGMFMAQLVNPYKYTIYPGFYESCGPEGEKLIEYVEKEWKKQPHIGEMPLDIIAQAIAHGDKAIAAIDSVAGKATKNKDEFKRLRNDMHCYREFAYFFENKVKAAKLVLDYQWGKEISKLDAAIPYIEKSLEHYKKLVDLTKDTYWYANSMQTAQRAIPISGLDGKNKTWEEMYIHFQNELENYKKNLSMMKTHFNAPVKKTLIPALTLANVKLISKNPTIKFRSGDSLYSDYPSKIIEFAPELANMIPWFMNANAQRENGTDVEFETDKPVKLLIGYYRDDHRRFAKAPKLETDASANLYSQAEPVLFNAISIDGLPPVNVHAFHFDAGYHKLLLPKGLIMVIGFTNADIKQRNAGLAGLDKDESMDWMFN